MIENVVSTQAALFYEEVTRQGNNGELLGNLSALQNKKKILLIGWDAADWKVINPLMDNGMMPALESLVNQGVMGNIATLDPPLSPMLWTSIATGKHADQHGILGFTEPAPEGRGVRPCMITSRKVKAIWNILTQCGYKTNVVGWWPSHPAEPINGISISNFYNRATVEYGKEWPLAHGTIHPREKESIFKNLRVHPGELSEAQILPFVPDAIKIDQDKDTRLSSIGKIIAECSSIHCAATYILENEEWDFAAVYYDAIDHFCHGFMDYHPPKLDYISQEMFDIYKGVVEGGYIYHDMMLSRLLELIDDNTTVILLSDHGFHSDHLRPKGLPQEPAGPAWEHRDYGIFVMKGPGIRKDERVYGTTLLDIVPTILAVLGLPIAKDMEGKPVLQAFEFPSQPTYIDSWEEIEGECGMHPIDSQRDPIAEQAALQQLVELGYIEKPDENINKSIERTVDESNFYLSRVLMNKNLSRKALPILEKLYIKDSKVVRFAFQYAKCLDSLGKVNEAADVVEKIIQNEENKPNKPNRTNNEANSGTNNDEANSGTNNEANSGTNNEANSGTNNEANNEANSGTNSGTNNNEANSGTNNDDRGGEQTAAETFGYGKKREYPQLFLLKGTLELARKNLDEALKNFKIAEDSEPRMPQLHQQLAAVYMKMKRIDDAEATAHKALDIDPESAQAHYLMSDILIRKKDFESASEYALNAVGLLFNFPMAHFNLGVSLMQLGMFERAIEAFNVCIKIVPKFIRPYRFLSYIYRVHLKDKDKADYFRKHIETLNENNKK